MSTPFPRAIYLAHSLPGRLRMRLPWLHDHREQARVLAERLVALEGMQEVRVRAYTGSVLCSYDAGCLDETTIVATVRRTLGIDAVLKPGEPLAAEVGELVSVALEQGSTVARAATTFFKSLNQDIIEATEGRFDFGTLAALTFASAGLAEVVRTRELPLPKWYQLAWWAFGTFSATERSAIESTECPIQSRGTPV